jgi:hypothetical protein
MTGFDAVASSIPFDVQVATLGPVPFADGSINSQSRRSIITPRVVPTNNISFPAMDKLQVGVSTSIWPSDSSRSVQNRTKLSVPPEITHVPVCDTLMHRAATAPLPLQSSQVYWLSLLETLPQPLVYGACGDSGPSWWREQ